MSDAEKTVSQALAAAARRRDPRLVAFILALKARNGIGAVSR
jgi:hypothetical protein